MGSSPKRMHAGLAGVVHTYTYTCTHICLYVDMCTRTHTHVDVHIHIHMYTYTRTKMCSKIAQIARIQNWHVISPKQATTNVSRIPVVVSLSRVVRAGDVNIGPTTASYRGSCLVQDSQNTHRIRETTIREAIRETIRKTMLRETTTRSKGRQRRARGQVPLKGAPVPTRAL